jgi:hypothetical protein
VRASRAVTIAALVFAAVYIALDFNKLFALRYGADTGTFLQFLANEAHGLGSWNNAEYRPHLQVHDSWMLLVLTPLIAAFPYAQTLLVLQVLAMAAAAVVVAAFARWCGASPRSANVAGIAYLISPCTQGIAYGNFLENAFVPLAAACAALAALRRNMFAALCFAQVLLGLKEDQALFVLWFGVACAVWWDRRIGVALAILAALNGAAFALYERAAGAHPSLPQYSLHVDDPFGKAVFFAALLLPFAFAPLWLGRRALLGAPIAAELVFNRPWAYPIARIGTHWTASALIAAALASAYALAKYPRLATPVLACAIASALLLNDTVLKAGRWPYVVDWKAYAYAAQLGRSQVRAMIERPHEGVYAVAAANPNVQLRPRGVYEVGYCPAYDRNARAFFASIGIGAWPGGVTLCQGVPVSR